MKTYLPKVNLDERKWYLVDAKGAVLGHVAERIANILRGKNKPTFTPHLDTGDFVVVVNADQIVLTGQKEAKKVYTYYSGFVGGQKRRTTSEIRQKHPELLVYQAVKGMVPKNKLGRKMMTKLKVYSGEEHPHTAQQPIPLEVETLY